MKYNGKVVNTNNAKKAIVVKFRKNDANGWEDGQTGNCTGTGYLNKKFVHPCVSEWSGSLPLSGDSYGRNVFEFS